MTNLFRILALGVALSATTLAAQARPVQHGKVAAAPPAKARQAAMDGFSARMNRLDALMGTAPVARTRSASAER
jgi:hypothetical protein